MEKEPQPESMATVTIKPEYPPSEYSSEPPPAYIKPRSTAVKITKIVAVTVVLTSVILGSFLLASAYVSANANWRQLEQELELLGEASDRQHGPLQPEALIQEPPQETKSREPLEADSQKKENTKEIETNNIDNDNSDSSESSDSSSESVEDDKNAIPAHFPIDLEELAASLVERNSKTKMNCIVEKKKAEEVVDHQPKLIRLPFGINITTDPKFEKLSGERMVIVCESGTLQRSQPPQTPSPPPPPKDDEDQDNDAIFIQHVMIPIPETRFQTHMPQQMPPMMQNAAPMRPQMGFPYRPMANSMETMRPPMPPMMHIQIQAQPQTQQQPQSPRNEFPPNPILQHIAQEIIAQKIMQAQRARQEQLREQQLRQQQLRQQELQQEQSQSIPSQVREIEDNRIPQRFQAPSPMIGRPFPALSEEILTHLNRLPNRDVIVAVSESDSDSEENSPEYQDSSEMRNTQEIRPMQRPLPLEIRPIPQEMRIMRPVHHEMRQLPQEIRQLPQEMRQLPQEMRPVPQMQLVPQEIHIIPEPARMVPPQKMAEQKPDEVHVTQMRMIPQEHQTPQEPIAFIQEQRQNAVEMNGRQTYEQAVPVPIPVAMMQQQNEQESQESQTGTEESRPHFVQPRSIQSAESLDS